MCKVSAICPGPSMLKYNMHIYENFSKYSGTYRQTWAITVAHIGNENLDFTGKWPQS